MSKQWPIVSLGELLRLERRKVEVEPEKLYQEIGIYCFGRGIFHKNPRTGFEVGDKDLFLMKKGDFILQVTFAWEGAVAIVSAAEDGMYGSTRYPTFRVDEKRCVPHFLLNYFKTEQGRQQLVKICPGSAGRNRVLSIKRIPEVLVPLPPLAEQRRVVARIEELAAQIHEVRTLRHQAAEEADAFQSHVARDLFPEPTDSVVSDWMKFQTGYAFKSEWFSESGVRLARNANVGHGTLDWSETVRLPESRRAEFPRFELEEGDILITLDRPIISTGVKVARVRKKDLPCLLLQRVARAQFQSDAVLPEYFFRWLRSPHFAGAIDPGRSNGVPHISHKDIEKIPFAAPPLAEQRRIVAELDALQAEVAALKRLQAETAAELDALLPAILDRAFKGEL
jgi:type I restriction enzyme S subunit